MFAFVRSAENMEKARKSTEKIQNVRSTPSVLFELELPFPGTLVPSNFLLCLGGSTGSVLRLLDLSEGP